MKLLPKQDNAVYYLRHPEVNEVLYGGAAGGGKSAFGCMWLIEMCQKYPGSRWLMGRAKLKTLKETTLATFFDISSQLGITGQYNYNQQSGVIYWDNGSEILLKDLFLYPSDPNFDSLGSLEITGAFIDECNQVTYKAWQIVKSRIRYRLKYWDVSGLPTKDLRICERDDVGLPVSWYMPDGSVTKGLEPKILGTCNPAKNWVYSKFYQPSKNGTLPKYRRFIQALPTDNPHLPKSYLNNLLQLDHNSKERLYYGNWEYDDDPSALINFNAIQQLFINDRIDGGVKYITADIARFGRDKTVIMIWNGMRVEQIVTIDKNKVTEAADKIRELCHSHGVAPFNVIVDDDGVGGGVTDILGCVGFVNNSSALDNPETGEKENFQNLKSQMYFKLAEKINAGDIYVSCKDQEMIDDIVKELEQVKQYEMDKDGKKRVMPKDKIKELIGRSPDYSDCLMMRMYFVYNAGYRAPRGNLSSAMSGIRFARR